MNQTFEFYDARADEAAIQAAAATLENVRERCLRSEKTWRSLAKQALKLSNDREQARRERAERDTDLARELPQ